MTMVDHEPAKGESHDPTSSRPGRVSKGSSGGGSLEKKLTGSRTYNLSILSFRRREDVLSSLRKDQKR